MKTLIVHHIEGSFDSHLNIVEWIVDAAKHFSENSYEKIIYNVSGLEYHTIDDQIARFLRNNCREFIQDEISWGYDEYHFDTESDVEGVDYIRLDYSASTIWPIPTWYEGISEKDEVFIAGAFDQECVEELRAFLNKVNIAFSETELVV